MELPCESQYPSVGWVVGWSVCPNSLERQVSYTTIAPFGALILLLSTMFQKSESNIKAGEHIYHSFSYSAHSSGGGNLKNYATIN